MYTLSSVRQVILIFIQLQNTQSSVLILSPFMQQEFVFAVVKVTWVASSLLPSWASYRDDSRFKLRQRLCVVVSIIESKAYNRFLFMNLFMIYIFIPVMYYFLGKFFRHLMHY